MSYGSAFTNSTALTLNMLLDVFIATVERWKQFIEMGGRKVELYGISYTTVTPITYLIFINSGEAVL
jgi:hypothetical protein